jgi:protein-S-isoprenylcysteine O-methyltransferase Ste14
MNKYVGLLFGFVAAVVAAAAALYGIAFMANVAPISIDIGAAEPWPKALVVDSVLLALFGIQHSVMARQGFKRWWTRLIPPAIERSTYVLVASLLLALLCLEWRPITHPVWTVDQPAVRLLLQALFWAGWLLVLVAGMLANHLELIGLRQVLDAASGRKEGPLTLTTSGLYRLVRHPIYVGAIVAFWATPDMTAGHLLFSTAATAYTIFGTFLEERDLVDLFGDRYRQYQQRVRMLLPFPK